MFDLNRKKWFCFILIALVLSLSLGSGCSEDAPMKAPIPSPPIGKSCFDFRDYLHTTSHLETSGRNNGIAFGAGYLFVAGDNGLKIIDVEQSGEPELVAGLDTAGVAWDVAWADGVVFVAFGNTGLIIIDAADPATPRITGGIRTPGEARGIEVAGTLVYLADDVIGLMVFDVSDPAAPAALGVENTPGKALNVAVTGPIAYVADEDLGLRIVNVADPLTPWLINSVPLPGRPYDLCLYRGYALVAVREEGLQVVNVSVPGSESVVGSLDTPGSAHGVAVNGGILFVADESSGLRVVDVSSPPEPRVINVVSASQACRNVAAVGGWVYSVEAQGGVRVVNAGNPSPPPIIDRFLPDGLDPRFYDPSFNIDSDSTFLYGIAPGQSLFIAELRSGTDLVLISEYNYFYLEPTGLLAKAGFVVVADRDLGGDVYDVTDPYSLSIIDGVTTHPQFGIDLVDSVLYVATGSTALSVRMLGSPGLGKLATAIGAKMIDVAAHDGYAFVTSATKELIVVDVQDVTQPFVLARISIDGSGGDILIRDGYAYFATGEDIYGGQNGVAIYDLEYPFFPTLVQFIPTFGRGEEIALTANTIYVAEGANGLEVIDISNPLSPQKIGSYGTDTRITDVTAGGGFLFVAEDETGIFITRSQTCPAP